MVAIFLKAIAIYFIISFFRSLWRGYKMVDKLKRNANYQFKDFEQPKSQDTEDYKYQGQQNNSFKKSADVIEAEFRIIDKENK
ncbi:MAG: hypothetical protein HN576_07480 [Bacteriovoracaceae bacterium]|jgi:hypothetical protein|nr:hypothetical protein [Bacteriovoracaceae bacterium]